MNSSTEKPHARGGCVAGFACGPVSPVGQIRQIRQIRTAVESVCRHIGQGIGEIHFLQGNAAEKGLLSDGCNLGGNLDGGEIGAGHEGLVADGCDPGGNINFLEPAAGKETRIDGVQHHGQLDLRERRAGVERGGTDVETGIGQLHGLEFLAEIEGAVADIADVFRNVDFFELHAVQEGAAADVGYILGQLDRFQVLAFGKGVLADGRDAFRQLHGGEAGTVEEGPVADAGGAFGKNQFFQAGAVFKDIVI